MQDEQYQQWEEFMQRKKSLIPLLLFLMAPFLFAFPSEFYDEAIDQWIGDS